MIVAPARAGRMAKGAIRSHYDLATPFYRLLWGPHIHHGLWPLEDLDRPLPTTSPRVAQDRLTDALASLAGVTTDSRVLDVGCGMGGSSIRLARRHGCRATGITLSGVQRRWATMAARLARVGRDATFLVADAETVTFPDEAFDVVWSVECTEHLFDKPAFFARAARWIAPGGRMAIVAWLAARDADRPGAREQVERVCDAFLCPSLGSFDDYRSWMTAAGLDVVHEEDWTRRAERTWEVCEKRVRRFGLHRIARIVDARQATFLEHFGTLSGAYRSGAMQFGCIVARRP